MRHASHLTLKQVIQLNSSASNALPLGNFGHGRKRPGVRCKHTSTWSKRAVSISASRRRERREPVLIMHALVSTLAVPTVLLLTPFPAHATFKREGVPTHVPGSFLSLVARDEIASPACLLLLHTRLGLTPIPFTCTATGSTKPWRPCTSIDKRRTRSSYSCSKAWIGRPHAVPPR